MTAATYGAEIVLYNEAYFHKETIELLGANTSKQDLANSVLLIVGHKSK